MLRTPLRAIDRRALPPYRGLNRRLPVGDRCKRCWAPLSGLFSLPYRLFLIRRSRKNPRLCTV